MRQHREEFIFEPAGFIADLAQPALFRDVARDFRRADDAATRRPDRRDGQRNVDQMAVLVLPRSEEHTSELQSPDHLVCRLLLEKKKKIKKIEKNNTIRARYMMIFDNRPDR